jgi:hypothetical protein
MLKKIYNSITLKSLIFFVSAFLLATTINFLSGNYWINFSVEKTFTLSEAQILVNHRVRCNCMNNPLSGRVVSQQLSELDKQREITVEWDTPINNKFKTTNQDKNFFEHCMSVIE